MRWHDEGLLISSTRHGETSARLAVFTQNYGVWHGLLRAQRKHKTLPQIGSTLKTSWSARLESHLGIFTTETITPFSARLYDAPLGLLALQSLCALLETTLAERDPLPNFYRDCRKTIEAIDDTTRWIEDYIRWETRLLAVCGFGLNLSKCHAGGEGLLDFLSPRTGRAISRGAAESVALAPYRDRLLPLPPFLRDPDQGAASAEDLHKGLASTGFFLAKFLPPLPQARARLQEALRSRRVREKRSDSR